MNRTEIIDRYHDRIHKDERIKLTTEERAALIADFIEQLRHTKHPDDIADLCCDEITLLEGGYGAGSNSVSKYLSDYRKAIAAAVQDGRLKLTPKTTVHFSGTKQKTGELIEADNHLAFDLMKYSNEVYAENRRKTNEGNNARQDNPQPFDPDRYLQKATQLLQADEPETLAVGIAATTGRRHTEIVVSGRFTPAQHPYLLLFEGQLKKADPIGYAILTLLPAAQVLQAIERFRSFPQVQALQGMTSKDSEVAAFRARVNSRVKQHFQKTQILPILPGFQSVSIHRLRGAYARLALYYWLPSQGINEQRWLQYYLGHVSPLEMQDAANSNATSHYFGYRLVDAQGKDITARGIKLAANPLSSPTDQQLLQQQQANARFDETQSDCLDQTDSEDFTPQQQALMSSTLSTVHTAAQMLDDLPSKETEQATLADPDTPATADQQTDLPTRKTKRQARPRFRSLQVNLNTLTTAADHLGLELPSKAGYQALLDRVLLAVPTATNPTPDQQPTPQPPAPDLTAALSSLQQQLAQLKQHIAQPQADQDELQQLRELTQQQQTQINRLQADLEEANSLLQAFGALANRVKPADLPTAQPAAPSDQQPADQQPTQRPSHLTQSFQPTADAQPTSRPSAGRPSSGLSPTDRIPLAIAALAHHNQHCTHPDDRWFLSGRALKIASGTNQSRDVNPWLQQHPAAQQWIDAHNTAMQLGQRHNAKNKDEAQLKEIYQHFVAETSPDERRQVVEQFQQAPAAGPLS